MAKKALKKMQAGGIAYTKAKRPQLGGVKKAAQVGVGKRKPMATSKAKGPILDISDFGRKIKKMPSGAIKGATGKLASKAPAPPVKKATNLPAVTVTAKKAPSATGKTVSQVWVEKTGRPWSEAKKLGMSDGSAKSNMDLLKKLNSGAVSKSSLNRPSDSFNKLVEKNVKDEQEGRLKFPDAQPAMKRGGRKK